MAEHMAQQNAEGSHDLSTLVDASAELQHLVQTIWRLRQPDGCPWDREQTHQSIGKNMIEEAYEALDCIEADDAAHLREELGDVRIVRNKTIKRFQPFSVRHHRLYRAISVCRSFNFCHVFCLHISVHSQRL